MSHSIAQGWMKQVLSRLYLKDLARELHAGGVGLVRSAQRTDVGISSSYLKQPGIKCLQIGCGGNIRPGWLNTDFRPKIPGVLNLDAIKAFPLPSGAFDYVFSEHMIEHVPYSGGVNMLIECWRVLKPGGILRISTPDW